MLYILRRCYEKLDCKVAFLFLDKSILKRRSYGRSSLEVLGEHKFCRIDESMSDSKAKYQ